MEKSTGEVYSRSEKSLSALTKKFVGMLQASEVLDLNVVRRQISILRAF